MLGSRGRRYAPTVTGGRHAEEGDKNIHVYHASQYLADPTSNADDDWDVAGAGFDAATVANMKTIFSTWSIPVSQLVRRRMGRYPVLRTLAGLSRRPVHIVPYRVAAEEFVIERPLPYEYYPCAVPNWDNTPRSGSGGSVLSGSTPALYEAHLRRAVARVADLPPQHRVVFIKSWNEWAEGNYLEPDQEHGHTYLDATRRALSGGEGAGGPC